MGTRKRFGRALYRATCGLRRLTASNQVPVGRQRSQALVLFGLLMPVILFGVGIAFDVGYWYVLKRHYQTAADLAALIGSQGIEKSTEFTNLNNVLNPANQSLNDNGIPGACTFNFLPDETGEDDDDDDSADDDDDDGDLVPAFGCFINHPPLSGQYMNGLGEPVVVTKYKFVEVIIKKPAPKYFFHGLAAVPGASSIGNPAIYARAVAGGLHAVEYAIMALGDGNPAGGPCPQGGSDPLCFSGAGGESNIEGNVCSAGGINLDQNVNIDGTISSNSTDADAVTYPGGWPGDPSSIVVGSSDPCVDPGCGNRDLLPLWVPLPVGDLTRAGNDSQALFQDPEKDIAIPGPVLVNTEPVLYPNSTWPETHQPVGPDNDHPAHLIRELIIQGGFYVVYPNTWGLGGNGTTARGWRKISVTAGSVTFMGGGASTYYRSSGTVDDFVLSGGTVTFSGPSTFKSVIINTGVTGVGPMGEVVIPSGSKFEKLVINGGSVIIEPNTGFKTLEITGGTAVMKPVGSDDKFSFDNFVQQGGTTTMQGAFYAENYCFGNSCSGGPATSNAVVLGTIYDDYLDFTPPQTTTFVAKNKIEVTGPTQFGQSTSVRVSGEANANVDCNMVMWLLGKGADNTIKFSGGSVYLNGTIYAPVISGGGPAVHIAGGGGDTFSLDSGQIIAWTISNTGTGAANISWEVNSAAFASEPFLAE